MDPNYDRYEVYAVVVLDVVIVGVIGFLAFHVTPWALLGLFFIVAHETDGKVTVETANGSTVTVRATELDESTIRETVRAAENDQ